MNAYEVTYYPEHQRNHKLTAVRFYADLEQAHRLAPVYFSSLGCEIGAIRPTTDPRTMTRDADAAQEHAADQFAAEYDRWNAEQDRKAEERLDANANWLYEMANGPDWDHDA